VVVVVVVVVNRYLKLLFTILIFTLCVHSSLPLSAVVSLFCESV